MRRLCLLFLLVAPLAWVQVSWAQEPYPLSDEDKKIVEMSRSILQSAVDGASETLLSVRGCRGGRAGCPTPCCGAPGHVRPSHGADRREAPTGTGGNTSAVA